MTTEPVFESVDNYTSDLLALVADEHPATLNEVEEWEVFTAALRQAADATGHIDQNTVRPIIRGRISPRRIGAFYSRACARDLIQADGWSVSDDTQGRNSGRPMRTYLLLGRR